MSNLPFIPIPQPNLRSLTATLKAMRQYILALSGEPEAVRQPYKNSLSRSPAAANQEKQAQWEEHIRVMEDVKIENPNDPEQYVIMQLTKHLVLKNSITGEFWVYNRDTINTGVTK